MSPRVAPLLALIALAVPLPPSRAGGGPRAQARLVAGSTTVAAGSELELGLVLKMAEGWHVYWRHPGESGAPPQLELTLPAGVERAGPVRWPAPERLVLEGGIVNQVYAGEVALLVPLRVGAEVRPGDVELTGRASWLACDADGCVSEEAPLRLTLRVVAPGGAPPAAGPEAELLARARATVPRAPRPGELEASWEGTVLRLVVPGAREVSFFPAAPEEPLPDDLARAGRAAGDALRLTWPARIAGHGVAGHLRARVGEAELELWVDLAGPEAGAR